MTHDEQIAYLISFGVWFATAGLVYGSAVQTKKQYLATPFGLSPVAWLIATALVPLPAVVAYLFGRSRVQDDILRNLLRGSSPRDDWTQRAARDHSEKESSNKKQSSRNQAWSTKDYYAILGVPRSATKDEVTHAYRQLAKKYHPDANPLDSSAEERFKEISAAYETLNDPAKRTEYDEVCFRAGSHI